MNYRYKYPPTLLLKSALAEKALRPDLDSEIASKSRSEAATHMCWTCGSCDSECPVNIATGRLRPQKIIRLATLGLMDELLSLPEIWYCISCRRCLEVCPNLVKPQTIIAHIRNVLVADGAILAIRAMRYKKLFSHFQRVRWIATAKCMQGEFNPISVTTFEDWLQASIPHENSVIPLNDYLCKSFDFKKAVYNSNTALCHACGECSSACPVSFERSIFDARTIIRMANFGLMDELLSSPSLWLCIGCGRCSDACSQYVDGRSLIEDLRQMATERGIVDSGFRFRLERANKIIYSYFLSHIDSLLQPGSYSDIRTASNPIKVSAFLG